MPSTTTPTFGGGLQQYRPPSNQSPYYTPMGSPTEQAPSMYRDDEYRPASTELYAPAPIMQPTAAQAPKPWPTPPPQPKPGYETGVTSVIGTPIPGTETPLGAVQNDGKAGTETTTAGMQNMIRDSLLNLLSQPAPTAQDPNLSPVLSAFNAAQNRASARQVAANAEAFGANGLESSGARLAADQGVMEQQGLNEGQFAANAVLTELQSRRDRTMQALQMASAINDQDLSRRLQEQLAQLNATIQRESLTQTGRLGDADIALREKLGMGNLNLGLLGIAQQGRQFNDSLGFNLAQLESTLNNQALVNLLYGGR